MLPGLQSPTVLTPSSLPDDAIEVGRILDAWGVKGWVKIQPHSTDPEALFSAKAWFLQAPEAKFRPGFTAFSGTVALSVDEAKTHSDSVVAKISGLDDRNAAEALRGARIFLPRSSFPAASLTPGASRVGSRSWPTAPHPRRFLLLAAGFYSRPNPNIALVLTRSPARCC